MKYWILIATVFCFVRAVKADPVNITCTTDPLTTSLAVFTNGQDVTFRVIHHNGLESIPLANANVTPQDLPKLAQKAKVLQQLGSQYDIHLKADRCSIDSKKLVSCYSPIDQMQNGHHLSYFSFDTAAISTVSPLFPVADHKTSASINITIDGMSLDFEMKYSANRCVDTN